MPVVSLALGKAFSLENKTQNTVLDLGDCPYGIFLLILTYTTNGKLWKSAMCDLLASKKADQQG